MVTYVSATFSRRSAIWIEMLCHSAPTLPSSPAAKQLQRNLLFVLSASLILKLCLPLVWFGLLKLLDLK